jgi:sugar phosphate isomerase/epimerase
MKNKSIPRRQFLQTTAMAATAVAAGISAAPAAETSRRVRWPIGCLNRPWTKWTYEAALDGTKAAGYKLTGLLTRTKTDPLIGSEATTEYLEGVRNKIAARGLTANMAALRTRLEIPVEESIRDTRRQIDNARFLSLQFALSFGVDQPAQYENYYRVMADAAAYGQERGIKLVLKPHGGGSGAAEEILRCLDKVNHPNFKVWYDAGNIIHYTGKDPAAELEPIARHVTGFCAKDCARQKGEVMIQFGTGKVDFEAVFKKLKAVGFDGPVMVECCAVGQTPEETTANARANREFLEKVFASI